MVRGSRYSSSRRRNHAPEHSTISGPLRALELAYKEADARKAEAYRRGVLPEYPTFIEHGPLRVLVSASPTDATLSNYINTLTIHNVTHVVRLCEPYYDANHLRQLGFETYDWSFPDGEAPPQSVVTNWLTLLDKVFRLRDFSKRYTSSSVLAASDDEAYESDVTQSPASSSDMQKQTVAIHCAAGLGRAPALVALALVELGLHPMEAVGWLRAMRRGAINGTQLAFLHNYVPRPPPSPPKPERPPSRSFAFWPSLRSARAFRCRTPSNEKTRPVVQTSPVESRSSVSPRSAAPKETGGHRRTKSTDFRFF